MSADKSRSTAIVDELKARVQVADEASRSTFLRTGDGAGLIRRRTHEVESLFHDIWTPLAGGLPVAVFAVGGFGRRELFPASDIDVLFLCASESAERDAHAAIRAATQTMWDIGLRASPATRTLKDCERLNPVSGVEFAISLLERRFLAGDDALGHRFDTELLPSVMTRETSALEAQLAAITRERHARFGDTIFHLEPNIKEGPGGLRDLHLIAWLQMLRLVTTERARQPGTAANEAGSYTRSELQDSFEFLAATRCFLHFRNHRDDNLLDWTAQDEASAQSIGLETLGSVDPAYWMRTYYRHARSIWRRANLLLDRATSTERRPMLKGFRRKRTIIPGTNFHVQENRIVLEHAEMLDADTLLRVFGHIAQHGSRFDEPTEALLSRALPGMAIHLPEGPFLWNGLRDILLGPEAAHALRIMHALGLLDLILPEFHGIDSLVVRDAYHRYTVDEHTFLALETVQTLAGPAQEWAQRFAMLLPEIERRDLLMLAILLHDTGKARRSGDHAGESVALAEGVFERLEFDQEERSIVRSLIRSHLEMSLALRRDIFDPETVRAFSENTPSQQQLKMLTLLTFGDIKAVNPDALTPWKAESLWQLYIATAGFLDRSVDESRYHVDADPVIMSRILARVTLHGGYQGRGDELRAFLEGMPRRYLQTRLPDRIGEHFRLARELEKDPIQLGLGRYRQLNEFTLVTPDRAKLFADVSGVLSAWGMNIVKADAFSNDAGIVLDSFQFTDPFRTLELNAGERERLLESMRAALRGQIAVDTMLEARNRGSRSLKSYGSAARFYFDDESSSHSTLLQVVAPDSPGLLRALAVAIADSGCSIEIALIDTEGDLAIDVFYLRAGGSKLGTREKAILTSSLAYVVSGQSPGVVRAPAGRNQVGGGEVGASQ